MAKVPTAKAAHPPQQVLLSLGSNIGEPRRALAVCIARLEQDGMLRNLRISPVYRTEPYGYRNQADFLNLAVTGDTELSPEEFFRRCKELEAHIGRKHRPRWHEREIDIDIILFGTLRIVTTTLRIPHPHAHERRFVLQPAADVAPDMLHPGLHRTVAQLLEVCPDTSAVSALGPLAELEVPTAAENIRSSTGTES